MRKEEILEYESYIPDVSNYSVPDLEKDLVALSAYEDLTGEQLAKIQALYENLISYKKTKLAQCTVASGGSAKDRETEALKHPEYIEHLKAIHIAAEELYKLDYKHKNARTKWSTVQSILSNRKVQASRGI